MAQHSQLFLSFLPTPQSQFPQTAIEQQEEVHLLLVFLHSKSGGRQSKFGRAVQQCSRLFPSSFSSMVLSLLESPFCPLACHLMVARRLLDLQASCLHLRYKERRKRRVPATSVLFSRKAKPSLNSAAFPSPSLAKENGNVVTAFN